MTVLDARAEHPVRLTLNGRERCASASPRRLLSDFLRGQGINVTCIYRPAYYYAMHRVDYTAQVHFRGSTWAARFDGSGTPAPGRHTIVGLDGNRLILRRS